MTKNKTIEEINNEFDDVFWREDGTKDHMMKEGTWKMCKPYLDQAYRAGVEAVKLDKTKPKKSERHIEQCYCEYRKNGTRLGVCMPCFTDSLHNKEKGRNRAIDELESLKKQLLEKI